MKLTKTQQKLLNRKGDRSRIWIAGARECDAALDLVKKGLAARYVCENVTTIPGADRFRVFAIKGTLYFA